MQHLVRPPPSLLAQVPRLSREVEGVVFKALAKDPKERFVTVQAFTAALEQAVWRVPALPGGYDGSRVGNNERLLAPDPTLLLLPRLSPGPKPAPRVDWGDALAVVTFYGREEEMAQLSQWVLQERCRVVSVLGMGGIGKSALVISVTNRLLDHFEVVIVRSLRDAPACEDLLDDCLQVFSPVGAVPYAHSPAVPATLERRISLLLGYLRKVRTLLVLDNLEGLLQEGDVREPLRCWLEGYGQLLHQVAEVGHQSCQLLTSRERPGELRALESRYTSVRSLGLAFAPDGKTLASANADRTINLWEVGSGRLLRTLPGQTDRMNRVVWSPDGRTLASFSYDKAIWLWDVEQGRHRAALLGPFSTRLRVLKLSLCSFFSPVL